MPLIAGDRLGPYEIVCAIGAGGMGEVYKARDTRLDRTVAVKVLPEAIALRGETRARFEREARAVASLNHPHICSLFDIGPGYMVMELIEGETLAARIGRGAIPLEEALRLAGQIADALDRAHRAGVTHRDVKPQNIMVTRDGVKVLDFGLAKTAAGPGLTDETETRGLTAEGMILGTPQYMAPEQFAGKEADARSDIWAFGAVVYEMVTGQKAFRGKDYSSLVAAILSAEPAPMPRGQAGPEWLERLVGRCLAKDPEDRWQSMRDIVLELRAPAVGRAKGVPGSWVAMGVVAAVLVVAAGGWQLWRRGEVRTVAAGYRFQISPPEGGRFDAWSGFALSTDGRSLAFFATAPGRSGLWVRALDGKEARLLPGTAGGSKPFWSPDHRSIGYWASNKIWRVEVSGGTPMAVCDAHEFRGGSWTADGTIVFGVQTSGLHVVPATGGTPKPLTTVDTARGETGHRYPQLLGGGRVLFLVVGSSPEVTGVYATTLGNPGEKVQLVRTRGIGVYAGGHLLWLRGSTLLAQPFDPERVRVSGEPRAIADPVGEDGLLGMAAAASENLLVHDRGGDLQLTWVDHKGQPVRTGRSAVGPAGGYASFRVSPDGRRIAVSRRSDDGRDLWMVDVERDAWSRFTFLPGYATFPVWSPDSRYVMVQAGSPLKLYRKEASGAGTEQLVTVSEKTQWPSDWSRDGRLVLYGEVGPGTQRDLWVLPVTPEGSPEPGAKARPYVQTRFNENYGRFSPERSPRWVSYQSNESGRDEVYVQGFPEPRGKVQISTGGGTVAEWSPDGKELYYMSPDRRVMAVRLELSGDRIVPSAPRALFALSPGGPIQAYTLAPDGKRFLVLALAGDAQPLEVIVNWRALLRQGE